MADSAGAARNAWCPRCGDAFHCGVADAAPCACTTLTLSAQTLAALRARHVGCLCLRCLQNLADAAGDHAASASRPPSPPPSALH